MDQNVGFQYRQDFNDMVKRMPNQPQAQCFLADQMIRLWTACFQRHLLAIKLMLYDVSNFLQNKINNFNENLLNRSFIYIVVFDCKEEVSDH